MLKNYKRNKRNIKTRLGTVERLEDRQMLDGYGIADVDLERFFPEFASPVAYAKPDEFTPYRQLNYSYYSGRAGASRVMSASRPDIRVEEAESRSPDGPHSNDAPIDAEKIALGFDAEEFDSIDIRGRLIEDVDPELISEEEQNDSIWLAQETNLSDGEAVQITGAITPVTETRFTQLGSAIPFLVDNDF